MALSLTYEIRDGSTKGNTTRTVRLTPMKAIRYQCLECVGWSFKEVELCTDPNCPLHPYRSGKRKIAG